MKRTIITTLIVLLTALVVFQCGRLFGHEFGESEQKKEKTTDPVLVTLEDARTVWSEATSVELTTDGIYEVKKGGTLLGFIMRSTPQSEKTIGYIGQTPLLIALDTKAKVYRVVALENDETPGYFAMVTRAGLLDAWNGLSVAEAVSAEVDAVSGATYSSRAVIQSLQKRLAVVGEVKANPVDWGKWVRDGVLLLFVLLTLWAWFRPQKVGRYRRWILLGSVLIVGVWQGRMLSMAQFLGWITGGIPLPAQWLMLAILLLALLLPIITGKAYYCSWLCPMGAAQSLLGDINKKHKLKLSATLVKWLQILRTAILLFGLLAIGVGLSFDFADIEAFTIFRPQSAPIVALVLAIVSLLLSIFVARPWCRFLCPLGEVLEDVRRRKIKS